ncbi:MULTISPECIES: histidine kinase [unclassified Streptomyces]|uniref:sensor histidine kinase n=1 Tax=unclassified Streptomyces TaxID=2593676 RepID=UPI002E165856|nr:MULTISPECIES: histidine kinase [unclassified Streptomyces]WSR24790.1 sensor histidine kinase [Streptomyces sp. NBC_01205]
MGLSGALRRTTRRLADHAPWSAWAWRSTTFTAAAIPMALPAAAAFTSMVVAPGRAAAALLAVLILGPLLTLLQRSRFRELLEREIPAVAYGHRPLSPRGLLERLRSESTWRQYGYHLLVSPLAGVGGALIVLAWAGGAVGAAVYAWAWMLPVEERAPGWTASYDVVTVLGGLLLLTTPWLAAALARLDAFAAAALLGPNRAKELERRVEDLAESRAGVLDAADLERRRIERDLHDGAQQRLVALAMNLGIARATLTDLPPEVKAVIDEAHREAKEAIEELNNLVRGLHPAVLEDRGLDAALSGIAARAPLPVELTVDLAHRPGPTVEAVAYFVVSEALANVAKHAKATRCRVEVSRDADLLHITVTDDGVGGADPAGGTGLVGLRKRVGSVDGSILINSPLGGPTVVTVELPCGL